MSARFDDPNLVSCAGLVPVMRLAQRCDLAGLVTEHLKMTVAVGAHAHLKIPGIVAGMLAGDIFHVANRTIVILVLAVATFWWRQGGAGRSSWLLLGLVLLLVVVNEWGITPVIEALKAQIGHGFDTLAKGDPLRVRFGTWHGISAVLHLITTLAAAWLVAAGGGRRGEGCAKS